MSNRDRVLDLIERQPGLSDREIRERSGIEPHQQVNQICRDLTRRGLIRREERPDGVLGNYLVSHAPAEQAPRRAVAHRHAGCPSSWRIEVTDWADTVVIIPCSARKCGGGSTARGRSILDDLPAPLADELRRRREDILGDTTRHDQLMPAVARYDGNLFRQLDFETQRIPLERLLILSGGYGVVRADEPIAHYDIRFSVKDWPGALVSRAVASYADGLGAKRVVAFASATTDYAAVIRRVEWRGAGVAEAWLILPNVSGGGAMVKGPAAIGQAVAALLQAGSLDSSWAARDGTTFDAVRLA